MNKQSTMQIKLQVTFIRQGKKFVAYSPALDISTTGKTLRQAQTRFSELLEIFFEELAEKETTDEVLTELGWVKVKKLWEPPRIVKQESLNIRVPVAA